MLHSSSELDLSEGITLNSVPPVPIRLYFSE